MPSEAARVEWEVAADHAFRRVVRRGRVDARPENAHTVHVTVGGLQPDRTYWYRFRSGGEISPAGRTRTTPVPGSRPGPTETYDFDNWDGYRVARQRVFGELAHVDNPVVLTGDRHATWVSDLKHDFYDPASATVRAELTGTSISSGGDSNPDTFHAVYDPIMVDSPHWKFIDNRRGYLLCDLDRQRWLTDLRVVSTVRAPSATVSTFRQFVTEAGQRGVHLA